MKSAIDRVYDSLRSVKLASMLLVYLAGACLIGGLIPQGKSDSFYFDHFSPFLARSILNYGLARIFSGILFMGPASLFIVNLTVCSFHRFTGELRKEGRKRRHGPDILHVGLIILAIGGIMTSRFRTESSIDLSVGSNAGLPDKSSITLVDFTFERYPDGRPKQWISRITISRNGQEAIANRDIKVNMPLRYRGFSLYQSGYSMTTEARLRDPMGVPFVMREGEKMEFDGGYIVYMTMDNAGSGVFLLRDNSGRRTVSPAQDKKIGPFILDQYSISYTTGLKIVHDPGYAIVFAGLILILSGAFMIYIQKLKRSLA
ncbi:MAG: cytochrome c biogenesis protein ResB [Rectinemataceae bacterium]|nr:cytochrome c biogenesis protein ResB [Rectinemataceae bacterium]